jgi:chromosome segregation ATPase
MGETSPIESALRRLKAALDHLESEVDHQLEGHARASGLESEVYRLGADRSRLAQSLDAAEARSAKLEDANREVSRRLVAAMESIRSVLDRHS